MFDPKPDYDIQSKDIPIRDFHEYAEEFVVRPPYQRKSVWSRKKEHDLLDSLFRRFYVPRIVLREIRLSDARTVREVIDGQQRITTVQRFIQNDLALPKTLSNLDVALPGKKFKDLPPELRRFVDRDVVFNADVIKRIDNPRDPYHQQIATEIFWRLQQGETLNMMEVAHARLASLVRNFVVKYADDQRFNYDEYVPVDENPDKLPFFQIIDRNNNRMQHLSLMARLLILELEDGPSDIRDSSIMSLIDATQDPDGIGDHGYEAEPAAKELLANLRSFTDVFKADPILADGGTIKELQIEYFIVSAYLLLRHLKRYYVLGEGEKGLFRDFLLAFHGRWKKRAESDSDVLIFSDNRQQSGPEISLRHRILRQLFFEFAGEKGVQILAKDSKRAFSEAERIAIYRRDEGLCQACVKEKKADAECEVPWKEFEADHVLPHAKGGQTVLENGQVLCAVHNWRKGAS